MATVNTKAQANLAAIRANTIARNTANNASSGVTFGNTNDPQAAQVNFSTGTVTQPTASNYPKAPSTANNATVTPNVPQYDIVAEIERARNAKIESRKAALQDVRDKTKSSINAEKSSIAPQYYDLRNQENASSQLRAKRVGEIMANKGYSEGYQGQAEIGNNVAYRSNLGLLKRQEQSAYDDIAKRLSDADAAYQTGLAQAMADVDTTASEQKLSELGTLRNYGREDAQNLKTDTNNFLSSQGKAKNPVTGEIVNTAAQEAQIKEAYANSISGLGEQFDYDAEIQKITNDRDTSNDWKIPYLKQERQKKIDTKLQDQIKTIGQYYADFDAEIQRRASIDPNDPLIPYLQTARQEKVLKQQEEAKALQKTQEEVKRKAYETLFKETGVISSDEMAKYLGIPKGTTSMDYKKTQYELGKPYYSPNSGGSGTATERKNNNYSEAYSYYKNTDVQSAINNMLTDKAQLIKDFGSSGFRTLWDDVFADAIRANQAKKYSDYFKSEEY